MVYAKRTKVGTDQTRYEIEKTLKRYGAEAFSYGSDDRLGMAVIMFRAHNRKIRFTLRLPKNATDQTTRSLWRALLLCVKAKLESVESKIETFEEAFMAHVVLPDGKTTSEWLMPQIAAAYESGNMPTELLALPAPT